mmetsp:Transcript_28868/g.66533  ORF Transcript_28868/g.66533 Transcript_28868/m.66533 type:complete len:328 (+) Transcript_28868:48-1031(+)
MMPPPYGAQPDNLSAWERAEAASQLRYPGVYGSMESPQDFLLKSRPPDRAQQILNVLAAIVIPTLIFIATYWCMSFNLHYDSPDVVNVIIGLLALFLLALAFATIHAARNRARGDFTADPTWSGYMFLTGAVALIAGYILGQQNFAKNMQPFYDVQNLNEYFSVDPTQYRGNQLMDSGKVHFNEKSYIDRRYAMGFQNYDTYCVAPIVTQSDSVETYDFWAVGTNCCTYGAQPDFRCGEYGNPHAKAGIRLMREDQRAFFRLAVRQAEAAFNLHANHPIFFYWLESPDKELGMYEGAGNGALMRAIFSYAGGQVALTLLFFMLFANK